MLALCPWPYLSMASATSSPRSPSLSTVIHPPGKMPPWENTPLRKYPPSISFACAPKTPPLLVRKPPSRFPGPRGVFAAGSFHKLPGLLWARTDCPQEAPDLPNLGSHGLAQVHALVSPAPMPEIAVALAPRSARAFCPTVHAAACPPRYCCLSTGATRSSPRSTPAGFGQIGEPSVNVSLTHGVVCHS